MSGLVKSYLSYAKGENPKSLWRMVSPLEWLAEGLVGIRNWAFDKGILRTLEAPLPVISVGNITLGGTNKTPFVEMVIKGLIKRGLNPGIVSRGYGGSARGPVVFKGGEAEREEVGDEPLLLSNRLLEVPVAVSKDRMADVRALRNWGVEIVVADDGFQHRSLARDLDIALVDAVCPFGNGGLVPGGILREPVKSLKRAHMVVITKSDQVSKESLKKLERTLLSFIKAPMIFKSSISLGEWRLWDGHGFVSCPDPKGRKILAFSAIGSPKSFVASLKNWGTAVTKDIRFKDHHRFTLQDLDKIQRDWKDTGSWAAACTEKDVYNLPKGYRPPFPLLVPSLEIKLKDEESFWRYLTKTMRPKIVVASNGHGEDAIGAVLAKKLIKRFPASKIYGFPLVGKGHEYKKNAIPIGSKVLSVTPTEGLLKYRLMGLAEDIRSGLFVHIKRQLRTWNAMRGSIRTPLCVGDVYLFLHSLWGQGMMPVLIATAKTSYLNGHWRTEAFLLRHRSRSVWARDKETALELRDFGVPAKFGGNPIMDLAGDNKKEGFCWPDAGCFNVLLLPGSRGRAYRDIKLLLDSALTMALGAPCAFAAVLAPGIDSEKLVLNCPGWSFFGNFIRHGSTDTKVSLYKGPVASAALGAQVLLGLGGTANQVCAGLGVPVVSVLEKGKLVQQKLLGMAEILVEPNPEAIGKAALKVLKDEKLSTSMAKAGRSRLGSPGALDQVVSYCSKVLGWEVRDRVYGKLKEEYYLENHKN